MVAQEKQMGRFSVEVELANNDDLAEMRRGTISPDKVRREKATGIVDSGATRLVIPQSLVERVGFEVKGSMKVRYAEGRTSGRAIARDVHLSYGGRESVFTAVVEPSRDSILIGALVLEELDFLIDCLNQRLVPRDPELIVSEIE